MKVFEHEGHSLDVRNLRDATIATYVEFWCDTCGHYVTIKITREEYDRLRKKQYEQE
jgi:hypothetical protein